MQIPFNPYNTQDENMDTGLISLPKRKNYHTNAILQHVDKNKEFEDKLEKIMKKLVSQYNLNENLDNYDPELTEKKRK